MLFGKHLAPSAKFSVICILAPSPVVAICWLLEVHMHSPPGVVELRDSIMRRISGTSSMGAARVSSLSSFDMSWTYSRELSYLSLSILLKSPDLAYIP